MSMTHTFLKAAATLPPTFTQEDLVVAAWNLDKEEMGLKGHKDTQADARKLQNYLYGKYGMIPRGFLAWVGDSLCITPKGLEQIGKTVVEEDVATISVDTDYLLRKLEQSEAYKLFSDGKSRAVTCTMALAAWGKKASDPDREIANRVTQLEEVLLDREEYRNRQLGAFHDWLTDRFGLVYERRARRQENANARS